MFAKRIILMEIQNVNNILVVITLKVPNYCRITYIILVKHMKLYNIPLH